MCGSLGGPTFTRHHPRIQDRTLAPHPLAGAAALSSFWVPLVTKKGGVAHRRAGWVYIAAAATIALTGLVGCARILTDDNPGNDRVGIFLGYVAVLAAANALLGVRSLGTKRRGEARRSLVDLTPPALLVLLGVPLAVFGAHVRVFLYVAFAALGVAIGVVQLRFWLRAPKTRHEWVSRAHDGHGGFLHRHGHGLPRGERAPLRARDVEPGAVDSSGAPGRRGAVTLAALLRASLPRALPARGSR